VISREHEPTTAGGRPHRRVDEAAEALEHAVADRLARDDDDAVHARHQAVGGRTVSTWSPGWWPGYAASGDTLFGRWVVAGDAPR
jgi:hypothetical protein